VDPAQLDRPAAPATVASSAADRAVLFEVLRYTVEPGAVPLARARVRVRIASATEVVFDRVVVTDTVVGDRGMTPELLAARVTREVLSILRPHVRRAVAGWR
ncbi:MAG: hypothetical protein M3680_36185, partial [Myxococcota bacterium]|nr:hypothetical protein [Myxococcota bacterium]